MNILPSSVLDVVTLLMMICNQVKSSIQKHVKDTNKIDAFMEHVFYHRHDVSNEESYQELLDFSNELDSQFELKGNRLFYLAMAPQFFWCYF